MSWFSFPKLHVLIYTYIQHITHMYTIPYHAIPYHIHCIIYINLCIHLIVCLVLVSANSAQALPLLHRADGSVSRMESNRMGIEWSECFISTTQCNRRTTDSPCALVYSWTHANYVVHLWAYTLSLHFLKPSRQSKLLFWFSSITDAFVRT